MYGSVSKGLGTHTGRMGTGRKGDTPVFWEPVHTDIHKTFFIPFCYVFLPLHLCLACLYPAAVECPLFILKDANMGKKLCPFH